MLEKIFEKIDNLSLTGKLLLFMLLLICSAIYVYFFAVTYSFFKLPKEKVAFVWGFNKDGSAFSKNLNADEILDEVATNKRIFEEDDPDKRRFLRKLREKGNKAVKKTFGEGLMYGIFSINLLWIPAIKFRKYRKAKKLAEEMSKTTAGKIVTTTYKTVQLKFVDIVSAIYAWNACLRGKIIITAKMETIGLLIKKEIIFRERARRC
jgi:hypothetical protein